MAKAAAKSKSMSGEASANGSKGESIAGYFRRLFDENPKLLRAGNNNKLYDRWLADHPGETMVPENVKQGLSNVKSQVRKQRGKRGRPRKATAAVAVVAVPVAATRVRTASRAGLEQLEHQIDECLTAAKSIDRDSLGKVIHHLRLARNGVVLQGGQQD